MSGPSRTTENEKITPNFNSHEHAHRPTLLKSVHEIESDVPESTENVVEDADDCGLRRDPERMAESHNAGEPQKE